MLKFHVKGCSSDFQSGIQRVFRRLYLWTKKNSYNGSHIFHYVVYILDLILEAFSHGKFIHFTTCTICV